jgi:hypothetical protein
MRKLTTRLALLVMVSAGVPAALAQSFKVGDHVEALPFAYDWYPCVVTQGTPNYRVKCTNIDGTTSDYGVTANRLRLDTGQAAALMASRWAQRFPIGSRVDAAPYGEQNGYHPCTVLSVKGNGTTVGIYHLKCDFGYANGPVEVDVGAVDHIRAATSATAGEAAKKQAALAEQNRPPAAVKPGSYVCSTFTGGRLQLVPGLDMKVTGSSSYVGSDGQAGTFSYDVAAGLVTFRGGALSGTRAKYLSLYGGQFKLMVGDHTANTDCNLRAQ